MFIQVQWCIRTITIFNCVQQQPPCPGGLPLSIAPGRDGPPVWYCGPSLIPFAYSENNNKALSMDHKYDERNIPHLLHQICHPESSGIFLLLC